MIERLPEPRPIELLTPRGGPRQKAVVGAEKGMPDKAVEVRALIERAGAYLRFLPLYSHDFSPIESASALIKKPIRAVAPLTAA